MPTIPDPSPPPQPEHATLAERFGDRWTITHDPVLHVWTADREDGTERRVIVAFTAVELTAKLQAAEQAGP
jgi:hypothetical protein